MFILVHYGYKQFKIFTIDCTTRILLDVIWDHCKKDILKLLLQKEEVMKKEIEKIQAFRVQGAENLAVIEKALEEERAKQQDLPPPPVKGKTSKGNSKKNQNTVGKSEALINLENAKDALEKELETINDRIEVYKLKISKIKEQHSFYNTVQDVTLEFVDKAGDRKFIQTKLDVEANTFLMDKGSYYLAKIYHVKNDDSEKLDLITLEGFSVRTMDEDEKIDGKKEELPVLKQEKKNSKGSKK